MTRRAKRWLCCQTEEAQKRFEAGSAICWKRQDTASELCYPVPQKGRMGFNILTERGTASSNVLEVSLHIDPREFGPQPTHLHLYLVNFAPPFLHVPAINIHQQLLHVHLARLYYSTCLSRYPFPGTTSHLEDTWTLIYCSLSSSIEVTTAVRTAAFLLRRIRHSSRPAYHPDLAAFVW